MAVFPLVICRNVQENKKGYLTELLVKHLVLDYSAVQTKLVQFLPIDSLVSSVSIALI